MHCLCGRRGQTRPGSIPKALGDRCLRGRGGGFGERQMDSGWCWLIAVHHHHLCPAVDQAILTLGLRKRGLPFGIHCS